MILTDERSREVRRWAEAEVIRLAGHGSLDEAGILNAVLTTNPWVRDSRDPWAQETAAAIARRAATATLAGLRRRTSSCREIQRFPRGLAFLVGGVALWGVLRVRNLTGATSQH